MLEVESLIRLKGVEEFWKVLSTNHRLRLTHIHRGSIQTYLRMWFWSRAFRQIVGFSTKSSLASYQELFCKITPLASSRPERWPWTCSTILPRFLFLYRTTNLVKLQIGIVNAIVALKISKIVVTSIAIIAISISTKITVDRVITDCIEFSQHCLGVHISLSKKTAKKVYNCLLISANVSLQHSDVKYMIKSGKGHYSFTDWFGKSWSAFFAFEVQFSVPCSGSAYVLDWINLIGVALIYYIKFMFDDIILQFLLFLFSVAEQDPTLSR